MNAPKFVHDDIIKVIHTGQVGTVKEVTQSDDGYVYGVQLRTDADIHLEFPEGAIEMVKIANDDETGLHLRYIT
jgi:hypothetical protein